jgi:type II secretion system protein G
MKRGFTLLELLVVIAIIGVLASVILASLNTARAKARDSRRVADLHEIQTALALYHTENGKYPIIRWATSEPTSYDSGSKWASLQAALLPYLKELPTDPSPQGTSGPWTDDNLHYAYGSNGEVYDLVAQLEVTTSLMCETKDWKYHHGEGGHPPEDPWCSGGGVWSDKLYADH